MKKTIVKFIATPAVCVIVFLGLMVVSAEPFADTSFNEIMKAQLIGWLLIIVGGMAGMWVYEHGGMGRDHEYEDPEI